MREGGSRDRSNDGSSAFGTVRRSREKISIGLGRFMGGRMTGLGSWNDGDGAAGGVCSVTEMDTGIAAGIETRGRVLGAAAMAFSSTMTDGSLPLVYAAVNSHGSPDFRHSVHGQRPVHRVFFLWR